MNGPKVLEQRTTTLQRTTTKLLDCQQVLPVGLMQSALEVVDASLHQRFRAEHISASMAATCSSGTCSPNGEHQKNIWGTVGEHLGNSWGTCLSGSVAAT
jgi:hypothetical protein